MTVLKVMFTAIVTAMVLIFAASGLGTSRLQPGMGQPDLPLAGYRGRPHHGRRFHHRRLLSGYVHRGRLATLKIDGMFFFIGIGNRRIPLR